MDFRLFFNPINKYGISIKMLEWYDVMTKSPQDKKGTRQWKKLFRECIEYRNLAILHLQNEGLMDQTGKFTISFSKDNPNLQIAEAANYYQVIQYGNQILNSVFDTDSHD